MENLSNIFENIYIKRLWGDGRVNTYSGSGSNPENAYKYVSFVEEQIKVHGVLSVVDLGHGDWEMWSGYKFNDVLYTGIEVANFPHKLASKHTTSSRRFLLMDALSLNYLPPGEMLISKDVLQHLSNSQIIKLLEMVNHFKFLIICNDIYIPVNFIFSLRYFVRLRSRIKKALKFKNPFFKSYRRNNRDISTGEFRGIDLNKKPFNHLLKNFKVASQLDYDGPYRSGITKRITFLVRN